MNQNKPKEIRFSITEDYYQLLKTAAAVTGFSTRELISLSLNEYLELDKYKERLRLNMNAETSADMQKVNLVIRTPRKEKAALIQAAKKCNLSLSAFVRLSSIYDVNLISLDHDTLKETQFNLVKIGTNINQIAKAINSTKGKDRIHSINSLTQDIESALTSLNALVDLQREMLKGYITPEELKHFVEDTDQAVNTDVQDV